MEAQVGLQRARLVVHHKGGSEIHVLDGRPITIGRAAENTVAISDPKISRTHLRIESEGEAWRWSDLGSQNGTLKNGRRARGGTLAPGDILLVGGTRVVFEAAEEPVSDSVTAVGARVSGPSVLPPDVLARRYRRLGEIGRSLIMEAEGEALFDRLIDAAVELTGSERGFLIEVRKEGMEFAAARNLAREDLAKPEFELSWSIAIQAGTRGESVLAVNAAADPRFAAKESVESLALRSVLCVPVKGTSRILGVIYVENRMQLGVYSADDQELMEMLADQAAMALTTRQLLTDLRRRSAEVEELNRQLRQRVERQEGEICDLRAALGGPGVPIPEDRPLIGGSARMDEMRHLLLKVAATDFPVLVQGESGTGKELVARLIHRHSTRSRKPFVSINCAAIPETLLENELFGHLRGAYTGAEQAKKGLFESADGGTIFLDEVSEMSAAMQSRLLRVLQEGEVRPLGAKEPVKVDVRVVAASNRDLSALVARALFREDLYYRLRVLPVTVPPLRERREDIPELITHFFRVHGGRAAPELTAPALDVLCSYGWPGNIRELENEVKRLCVLSGPVVEPSALSKQIVEAGEMLVGKDSGFQDLNVLVESIESREIRKALARSRGNKTRASELLGITRFTLQRKLDKYGIAAEDG